MKICILSMQRVPNFGSLLQAYGLKNMLEQLGHTVSFLDIEPNLDDNKLLYGLKNQFPEESQYSNGILGKLQKLDKYTFNRVRIKYLSKCQDKQFDLFRENVLGMETDANCQQFDCCVIGSDEVFNCLSGAPWGFTTQLFGNVRQADRVITYAASCGATVLENVPDQATEAIRKAFKRIDAFSVRDANTERFVSALSGREIICNLDPVLVTDFSRELESVSMPSGLPKRYCVVYSYYNRIHKESEIAAIKRFCKAHDMVPVAVGAPQMWIRNYPVLSPFEMLKVFQNAAFVITDTFHGTIFSAKYADQFAVLVRDSNANKLTDLVNRLALEKHLIPTPEDLEKVFGQKNDTSGAAVLTEAERSKSISYLQNNI